MRITAKIFKKLRRTKKGVIMMGNPKKISINLKKKWNKLYKKH
jgi:hypothetical protein